MEATLVMLIHVLTTYPFSGWLHGNWLVFEPFCTNYRVDSHCGLGIVKFEKMKFLKVDPEGYNVLHSGYLDSQSWLIAEILQ